MVNELKRVLFDFWKKWLIFAHLLIKGSFSMFQYSEGIFSRFYKSYDFEICTQWSRAHTLSNAHKISDQIPREP